MTGLRLAIIHFSTLITIMCSSAVCFGWWSGETWGLMTHAEITQIANKMIDVTWSPKNDIQNYRSPGYTRTPFYAGTSYHGVAYMMSNPVDDLNSFLDHVNNTEGGETAYGNDCSAFVSIAWKMTMRHTTTTIEGDSHVELLGSVGQCDDVQLLQGDACNDAGTHIVLFDYYHPNNTGIYTMEQTPLTAHREFRSWSWRSTYRPLRRKDITWAGIPTLSEWKRIFLTLFIIASGIAFLRYRQYVPAQCVGPFDKANRRWGAAIFERTSFRQISIWCSVSAIIGTILILILYGKVTSLDIVGIIICSPLLAYILNAVYMELRQTEN